MKSLQQTLSNKPSGNFFSRIGMVAVLSLIAVAPAAVAQTYNFTFTGNSGMDASGTIFVASGVALSGSINVINVPFESFPGTTNASGDLVPDPASPSPLTLVNHDGDDAIIDNIVFPGAPPTDQVLDDDGLGFASGPYQDSVHFNTLINLWGNSPSSYTLFVAEAQLDGSGNVIGDPQWVYVLEDGSLTLTAVPEPSTNALVILGALTVGFALIRRRRAVA
jgi:hypothetical protein